MDSPRENVKLVKKCAINFKSSHISAKGKALSRKLYWNIRVQRRRSQAH
jgi:hypothetical protein